MFFFSSFTYIYLVSPMKLQLIKGQHVCLLCHYDPSWCFVHGSHETRTVVYLKLLHEPSTVMRLLQCLTPSSSAFSYRNNPRLNHIKQRQLIFLEVNFIGSFPSNHKPGSFEAGPARGSRTIRLRITISTWCWNPELVTGTYMFTPGPAKPHVL